MARPHLAGGPRRIPNVWTGCIPKEFEHSAQRCEARATLRDLNGFGLNRGVSRRFGPRRIPKGLRAFSPALRGTSYAGSADQEFINLEKEEIKEYRILAKESTGYYHGLFKILVNSMIRDSEKHIELLQFLRQRLREQ